MTGLAALRAEAGYRSAKDFAKALGVPYTTYARWERSCDGTPDSPTLPMRSAWAIADLLGCTIDDVVGRAEGRGEGRIPAAYERLSDSGKARFDEYLQFLLFREALLAQPD